MSIKSGFRLKSILTAEEECVGRAVVISAYYVHKKLGPGLLERVYEVCFVMEWQKKDLMYEGN